MNFWIPVIYDTAAVLLLLICVIRGAKNGFAKTLVQSVGFAFSLLAAITVSKICASLLYTTLIQPSLFSAIEASVENAVSPEEVIGRVKSALDNLPAISGLLFDFSGFEENFDEAVLSSSQRIAEVVVENVLGPVIVPLLEMLIFVTVLIILLLVVSILAKGSKKVNEVPVIGGFNSFMGGVFGMISALVLLCCIAVVLKVIMAAKGESEYVSLSIIDRTYLFKIIYNAIINGVSR